MPAERVGGLIVVGTTTSAGGAFAGGVVLYAGVSSPDQGGDVDGQVSWLTRLAMQGDLSVGQVVTEVGSGLNGTRPTLRRILSDPDVKVIVMEHRDRLARLGVEQLEAALSARGRRIVVADAGETSDDLVGDMIEVLTWMCARWSGCCGGRNRAVRAVRATTREPGAG